MLLASSATMSSASHVGSTWPSTFVFGVGRVGTVGRGSISEGCSYKVLAITQLYAEVTENHTHISQKSKLNILPTELPLSQIVTITVAT